MFQSKLLLTENLFSQQGQKQTHPPVLKILSSSQKKIRMYFRMSVGPFEALLKMLVICVPLVKQHLLLKDRDNELVNYIVVVGDGCDVCSAQLL